MKPVSPSAPEEDGRRFPIWLPVVLTLILLTAGTVKAAPPKGKKGEGGGNAGSGFQPELRRKWGVALDASYLLVRPDIGKDGTVHAVDVFAHLISGPADGAA